ncbi:hypothetical protein BJY04DRAFT_180963, partial [Aspergillus karnatakaensis]|uniref:uncharacterized protein n=1 Tax=Aspergillus karnatakaensis TaxID=1810916 RepID=UPI003CCCCBEB
MATSFSRTASLTIVSISLPSQFPFVPPGMVSNKAFALMAASCSSVTAPSAGPKNRPTEATATRELKKSIFLEAI